MDARVRRPVLVSRLNVQRASLASVPEGPCARLSNWVLFCAFVVLVVVDVVFCGGDVGNIINGGDGGSSSGYDHAVEILL